MDYQCVFCQTRAFEDKVKKISISEEKRNTLAKEFYDYISNEGFSKSAPEAAGDIFALLSKSTNIFDPFKDEKEFINTSLMKLYPEFEKKVKHAKNTFDTALRLSIAGNIIDVVASPDYDINKTINHVLTSEFKINHSDILFQEIQKAKTILYLGDNAGEIVLDKLFIKTINHPNLTFAVRGRPVINDVTIKDATAVGMQNVAKVISNGSDAPSTVLSMVSDEFSELYNNADLIISKGQGNLEGLLNEKTKNIFFLFMVKCKVIGKTIGANKGDFVVLRNLTIQSPVPVLN